MGCCIVIAAAPVRTSNGPRVSRLMDDDVARRKMVESRGDEGGEKMEEDLSLAISRHPGWQCAIP